MYGEMHCVLRDMVQARFGTNSWDAILQASGLDEDHFRVFQQYPDSDWLVLIDAVSKNLDLTVDAVLKMFGGYFLTHFIKHGYEKVLTTLARDLFTFIQNLDSLHSMLSASYAGTTFPSFRCVEGEDGTMTLHYYSTRTGLYPIVTGMLEAAAKELFHQTATLKLLSQSQENPSEGTARNHAVLQVEVRKMPAGERDLQWPAPAALDRYKSCLGMTPGQHSVSPVPTNPGTRSLVTASDFSLAFPYHILLDRSLCICQCGDHVRRLSRTVIKSGTPLHEVGTIVYPQIKHAIEDILHFTHSVFLIAVQGRQTQQPLTLRGQMLWLPHCCHLLFLGSPRLVSLNDLKALNVYFADIPLYDATRDLVLLNQQRQGETDLAKKWDETIKLTKLSKELEKEKNKAEELLYSLIPKKIVQQLASGQAPMAERYKTCTVLFSDIVTFTDIAAKSPADEIVNMLNDMYHRFDTQADFYDVYKVETIGDAYMAVTGVPKIQDDHAERMADFAMDMMEEAGNVLSPATGKPLKIRVGMHTGSVVGGVIGRKKPRYDIYGDTVNTASRMESNSVPGRIHVSDATFRELYPYGYVFLARGKIHIKGKGEMCTYFLIGSSDQAVPPLDDHFDHLEVVLHPDPILRLKERPKSRPQFLAVEKITFKNMTRLSLTTNLVEFKKKFMRKINTSASERVPPSSSRETKSRRSRSSLPEEFSTSVEKSRSRHGLTGPLRSIREEASALHNTTDKAGTRSRRNSSTIIPSGSGCAIDPKHEYVSESGLSTFFDRHFDEEDPVPTQESCACRLM